MTKTQIEPEAQGPRFRRWQHVRILTGMKAGKVGRIAYGFFARTDGKWMYRVAFGLRNSTAYFENELAER